MFRLLTPKEHDVIVARQSEIEQTRLRMGTRALFSGQDVKVTNRRVDMGQDLDPNMGLYANSGQSVIPNPRSVNNTNVTYKQYMEKKMDEFAGLKPDPQERLVFTNQNWDLLQNRMRPAVKP
jgi:hypothetical protein